MALARIAGRVRTVAGIGVALIVSACADQLPTESPTAALPNLDPSAAEVSLQATPPGYIRIGVVPSATAVTLGADGGFTIRDKATGDVLLTGSGDEATVTLGEGAVTRTNYRLQVVCASAATRDDLVARAAADGIPTYVEDAGICWRVLLGEFAPDASFSVRNAYRSDLISRGYAGSDSFWRLITITEGETNVVVEMGDARAVATSPVVIEAAGGIVRIGGQPYRGVGEVWLNAAGTLAGINELPIEQYLYGVVPNELPPGPYGYPEAQKAQAVTARTYALANMGKRRADGYDLLPTTSDQVYRGYASEHPVSTEAIDATAGIVAVSNGHLITTLYHSTSGGFTANSEDVYTTEVSYLRGVPDSERGDAFEHVPTLDVFMRGANPINLRAASNGDFEADWSVYHRWVVEWTADEMAHVIGNRFEADVNEVHAIEVVDRADHGRVRHIRFVTDAGTFDAYKDNIRSRLPYYTSSGALTSLRSTLFFIEPITEPSTKAIIGWKAYGGGWGHGVGMSQTGAVGMAQRGRTFEQILKHYYRGIELEQRGYL